MIRLWVRREKRRIVKRLKIVHKTSIEEGCVGHIKFLPTGVGVYVLTRTIWIFIRSGPGNQ